jgi:hypothetical protein
MGRAAGRGDGLDRLEERGGAQVERDGAQVDAIRQREFDESQVVPLREREHGRHGAVQGVHHVADAEEDASRVPDAGLPLGIPRGVPLGAARSRPTCKRGCTAGQPALQPTRTTERSHARGTHLG